MSYLEIFKDQEVLTYKFTSKDADQLTELSHAEKIYFQSLTSEDRQNSFLSSHLLLNHILRSEFKIHDPQLKRLESGQWVLDQSLFFSISHSQDQIFIGVALCPIGVDVQNILNISDTVLKKVFHLNEHKFIEDAATATSLFSLKEAYGKALGKGLAHSKEVDFSNYIKSNLKYLTFTTASLSATVEKQDTYVYSCVLLKK